MSRWPDKKIGEVCELINGRAFKPNEWEATGMPIIRIQNLNDATKPYNYYSKPLPDKFRVCKNDILFSWSGTPGTSFGCFRWNGLDGWLNQHIFKVKIHPSLNRDFFIYQMNTKLGELIAQAHGGVGLQHVTKGMVEEVNISVPPLPEQERIVKLLDEADELRKLRGQADKRSAELIPALFEEMFGDTINPKNCSLVKLEDVATRITDGVHLKPNYTTSGVPFISVKNITTGKLKFDDCMYISQEDHERFTKRCKPEYLDVLYTKVGATYGRPAIVDTKQEFSIYVSVCIIKPKKDLINSYYLNAAMGTPAIKNQADRSIKGIGVPDLHLDQIQKFIIPLPCLEMQTEFAARVSEIRSLESSQSSSRENLDALFQSMMHQAFQGEL